MSEYWKSAPRHYCKLCQIWISGHPRVRSISIYLCLQNVADHEVSKPHLAKKEKSLRDMQTKYQQKLKDDASLQADLQAIESAAQAAMKKEILQDPTATQHIINPFRYSAPPAPPSSSTPVVARPLEEQRIAAFIAKATGRRIEVQSTVSSEDDFRNSLVYYDDVEHVPTHLQDQESFRIPKMWQCIEHEIAAVPVWRHVGFNIGVWEQPSFVGEGNETPPTSEIPRPPPTSEIPRPPPTSEIPRPPPTSEIPRPPPASEIPRPPPASEIPQSADPRSAEPREFRDPLAGTAVVVASNYVTADEFATRQKKSAPRLEAPLPGAWELVPSSESVFFDREEGLENNGTDSELDKSMNDLVLGSSKANERADRTMSVGLLMEKSDLVASERPLKFIGSAPTFKRRALSKH